jgi:voltage-gated potassium channel
MGEKERFEEIGSQVAGDKVLRVRRRKPRRRLRVVPNFPGVLRFIRDATTETPLIPLMLALIALWLISSLGLYLVERNVNEQLATFSYTLWWSFTAMQTQGANAPGPITIPGMMIGGIWSVFSTIAFFGVIIGTLYSYYMLPRRRRFNELVGAIQHNLDEMDNLSEDELEALKETTNRVIDVQIKRVKGKA